ncbi:MAG TPA: glycosyltransferase family 87 protein [Vicinamibacterales bacterium]|nr:glycosyltransferase family 87 protein [Vicinamibacterales bacterium]
MAALAYSAVHVVVSGIVFPLRNPNLGQVVEELQPIYRQMLYGAATVDQPRQYGPVFLFLLDPVYRATADNPQRLALYCYALDVVAALIALAATLVAIRDWHRERSEPLPPALLLGIVVLWANFGPLYGVLAVKNVELWELAFIAVACLALTRRRAWIAAWCLAAAALTKMLPLVFFPYLLLRDRRTFLRAVAALVVILVAAQLVYGSDMGINYFPNMIRAGAGASGFGNAVGLTWHENVSIRGVVTKAFGYLETPDPQHPNPYYSRGYYVIVRPGFQRASVIIGVVLQGLAFVWTAWMLWKPRDWSERTRWLWDFAFLGAMMLVLAPQASHDYMVLSLGAFSFALALCVRGDARWPSFVAATLLVANVVPRGLFARLVLIDPIVRATGFQHLTRAEAYQYFGFPLLGLLLLVINLALATPPAAGLARDEAPAEHL